MVNYTLAPGTKAVQYFLVKSNTGEICVKAALDREYQAYHELSVVAADRGM